MTITSTMETKIGSLSTDSSKLATMPDCSWTQNLCGEHSSFLIDEDCITYQKIVKSILWDEIPEVKFSLDVAKDIDSIVF